MKKIERRDHIPNSNKNLFLIVTGLTIDKNPVYLCEAFCEL
jgi:hypothetical protein